jgi:hypothetical protein
MFISTRLASIAALAYVLSLTAGSDALPAQQRDLVQRTVTAGKATTQAPATAATRKTCGARRKGSKVKRDIFARNGPDAKGPITLYHGTETTNIASIKKGLVLSSIPGDMAHSGGFYLTQKSDFAAQFACHAKDTKPDRVSVLTYEWHPTPQTKILEWTSSTELKGGHSLEDFILINNFGDHKTDKTSSDDFKKWRDSLLAGVSMVTGPMNVMPEDACLDVNFWQYAVIDKKDLALLKQVGDPVEKLCKDVPTRA